MSAALLQVTDLRVEFQTELGTHRAVDGASFSVAAGETLALVGESGCGKTVTALALMKLLRTPPAVVRGSVFFDGRDLLSLGERAMRRLRGKDLAMIFQEPGLSLNPLLNVGQHVGEAIRVHDREISRRGAQRRACSLLAMLGFSEPDRRLGEYPHELSGGMRQRLLIAMAIAHRPKLIIADEPTTSLDAVVGAQILDLFSEIKHQFGTAILLITHDLGIVARYADAVATMHQGVLPS